MIHLEGVCKIYNKGQPNEFTALREITLELAAQKISVLKGPSGSGKTTLLSLIGCMSRPTSGRIQVGGIAADWLPAGETGQMLGVSALPERFLTDIRRKTFGFIFQQFNLVRGISVLDNVMLPAYPLGIPRKELEEKADGLLRRFGLLDKRSQPMELLSGGEMQRVAIARALVNDPAVLIADEPTAHLDSRLSEDFMRLVAALRSEGKTVIIASHDPLVFAAGCVDAVVEMRDGSVQPRAAVSA